MSERIWGVRDPANPRYVEQADSKHDAMAWLGTWEEDAQVVYSDDGGETWSTP